MTDEFKGRFEAVLELSGGDLSKAIEICNGMYHGQENIYTEIGMLCSNARRVMNPPLTYGLTDSEKALLRANSVVPAIKEVRARTGLGLAQAKQLCDTYKNALENFSGDLVAVEQNAPVT